MARKKPDITPEAIAAADELARLKKLASQLFPRIETAMRKVLELAGADNPIVISTGETVIVSDTWAGQEKIWKSVPFDRFVVGIQAAPTH